MHLIASGQNLLINTIYCDVNIIIEMSRYFTTEFCLITFIIFCKQHCRVPSVTVVDFDLLIR
jgi:hypothetical protein